MLHKDAEHRLTEDDCLTSSQQYEPQLIFHVPLRRKGYQAIDANAFVRCGGLRVVDISGNRLNSLSGLESVAPQLTFINAAENCLHDISALVTCAALERCMLEGNKLASVGSLQPLVPLPCLAELVLQRHVPLDGTDTDLGSPQQSPDRLLLLDNPVCRDAVAYREHFLARVSHVRWVDGVSAYLRASSLAESTTAEAHDATANSTKAIVDAAIRSFQSIRVQMTATVSEETTLRRQLERAADRCKPSTATVAARTS
ncbi:hypothetical protein, conserved [Leishmania donovani]|uniref:Uncharacterized protein n=1 Tax=Leishmania donovani TaxID=5661 RepID=E9BUW1_LEIDO|nr:hypothetical protein, conserved [Leishmania donovani]TPP48706.1 hypothetical protein CGC21_15280 [Leishmania donovani]CBZ39040.1 hypothetical protein, conserved [Leishmania donovani]